MVGSIRREAVVHGHLRSAIRRRSWPAASWRREDGRGDPGTAGDREDPHALGIAGAGTASGAGTRPGAASGLTLPHRDSSGDPGATRAAGVGCVQGLSRPMAAVRRQGVTRKRRRRTTLFGWTGWAVQAQQISACMQRQVQGASCAVFRLCSAVLGVLRTGKRVFEKLILSTRNAAAIQASTPNNTMTH